MRINEARYLLESPVAEGTSREEVAGAALEDAGIGPAEVDEIVRHQKQWREDHDGVNVA